MDELIADIGALLAGNRTRVGDDPHKGTTKAGKPFGGVWTGPQFRAHTSRPGSPVPGVTFVGNLFGRRLATSIALDSDGATPGWTIDATRAPMHLAANVRMRTMQLPDDPVDLGAWVLDHCLPPIPRELDSDETVAIAAWSGEEYGAVLFVSWYVDEEQGESGVDTDVQTYRRVGGSWIASEGSGGGGWFDKPLERPHLPDDYAVVGHLHSTNGPNESCCAAYGFAGRSAAFVEVVTAAGSTVAPLDSPVGAFVVAADGSRDASVRVLDADHRVLTERRFAPDRSGDCAFGDPRIRWST